MERYLRSVLDQEVMRLLFRLTTGSAGLLEYKKSCNDYRCEVCNSDAGEDVEHLLMIYREFGRDWWVMTDELSRIIWLTSGWRNMGECARRTR